MTDRQLKLTILAATWLGPQVPTLLIGVPAVYYDRISLGGMLVGAAFMLAISGGAHLMLAWMQRNDEKRSEVDRSLPNLAATHPQARVARHQATNRPRAAEEKPLAQDRKRPHRPNPITIGSKRIP